MKYTATNDPVAINWQIQRIGAAGEVCMNAWSGAETGCKFGEYTKNDIGNMVEFLESRYVPHKVLTREPYFVEKRRSNPTEKVKDIYVGPEDGYVQNSYTGETLQNTNVFERVHYMAPGEKREILLPTIMRDNETRINQYQRWYNYMTGGPVESYVLSLPEDAAVLQFDNGTVMGKLISVENNTYYVGTKMLLTMQDVDKYILAADVSRYRDLVYDKDNPDEDMTEPTLSSRYLFEIRNANQMADELMQCREGSDKWLEDYEITCPGRSMNKMQDQLAVQYELQDYWFRRQSDNALQNIDSYARFSCELDTVSGHAHVKSVELHEYNQNDVKRSRFFYFDYTEVEGIGKYAYIKIYAVDNSDPAHVVRYQLARMRLNFLANSGARPADDIIGRNEDGTYKSMRSPEYMQALCGEPVAFINFTEVGAPYVSPKGGINMGDWDKSDGSQVTVDNSYAYPMKYENISYAYCPSDNMTSNVLEPGWGEYSLVKRFRCLWYKGGLDYTTSPVYEPVEKAFNKAYENDTTSEYYSDEEALKKERILFIDASEEPGRIARLDFEGNLCMGSRLYCSAWIASANDALAGRAPASLLFQFMGYRSKKDASGNPIEGEETEHLLYTFYTGQITTEAMRNDGTIIVPEKNEEAGFYEGIWQQIAFSFIPDRSEGFYDRYSLVLYNNCYDSQGGDILLDNIKVFVSKPAMTVEQSAPVCDKTLQLMKMSCRFQDIVSALGMQESTSKEAAKKAEILYCFLDADKYDSFKEPIPESEEKRIPDSKLKEAFFASLLGSTNPPDMNDGTYAYHHIRFSTYFEDDELQPLYTSLTEVPQGGASLFRETKEDGLRYFVLNDKIVDLAVEPGHRYYMVIVPRSVDESDAAEMEWKPWELFDAQTDCAIRSEFVAKASSIVKVDGDANLVVDDEVQYCAGSMPSIEVELTYAALGGGVGAYRGQVHDWWYGRLQEYNNVYVDGPSGTEDDRVYLSEAMGLFRYYYPDNATLDGVVPQGPGPGDPEAFTQQMIDLIRKYVDYGKDENLELDETGRPVHPYLALHRLTMSVPLATNLTDYVYLTVLPIEDKEADATTIVCYEPKEIPIHIMGHSPSMFVGLNGYDGYPENFGHAPMRVMLPQIRRTQLSEDKAVDLQVPINRKTFVMNSSDQMIMHRANTAVCLAGTDDPAYLAQVAQVDEEGRSIGLLEIGEVRGMTARKDGDSFVNIRFADGFKPREGYTYTLKMWFEEEIKKTEVDPDGKPVDNEGHAICDGTIVLDMKVVPEYEVWTGPGAGNADWTNDDHWARADSAQLYAGRGGLDGYPTNRANTTAHGFVPMRYTKVIVPKRADANPSPACYPSLFDVTVPPVESKQFCTFPTTATPAITYDMVVRTPEATAADQWLFCERFEPYVADSVLFQPGAELMRADRLNYNAAAVEYELTPGRWYTLGSPLQGMYAGDWYAPSEGGRQETTYFVGIDYDPAKNHRFKPAVYQRSWDKSRATATVYRLNVDASEDVATMADWSQVYNDVQVAYDLSGFSVKVDVDHMDGTKPAAALFRFPKDDTQYTYYTLDNTTDNRIGLIGDRTKLNSHRLYSDGLRDEDHLYEGTNGKVLTHTIEAAADAEQQYFLVSNPFVCGMDMGKFFDQNTWLERKYWLMTAGGQQVSMRNEATGGWVSVGGSSEAGTAGNGSIIAPQQAFFVKRKAEAAAPAEVQFAVGMMTSALADNVVLLSQPRREAAAALPDGLRITATRGGYASSALVLSATGAHDGYHVGEDAATLFDSNTADVPTVYTVSGGHALTINALQRVRRIPLGVESTSAEAVTLRFDGVAGDFSTLMLYDASTGETLPLSSGTEVEVPGRTAGRYFLVTEALSAEALPGGIRVDVDRTAITLTASAGDPLTQVSVIDAGGRSVYAAAPGTATHTFRMQKGVYIVRAATAKETVTRKVILK